RADVAECVLIKALVLQGWALCRLGQTDEALVVAEEALSLGQASGNQVTLAGIMNLMSTVYDLLGQYKPAIIYTERALELYRAAGKPVEEGVMLNNLGATLGGAGDYVRAISFFRQALDIAREFGDWNSEMLSLSNLGGMQVGIKDYTSAEHSLRHAIQIAETGGVKFPEPYAYLAEVFLGQGKMDEALAQALAAVDLGLDVQEDLGAAWRALGRVAGALAREVVINGQVMSAVACFSESLTVFTEMGAEAERARTLRVWAEYEQRQGNREAAVRLWARSREIFQQLGMDLELQRMDTGLML
ncbi:MAG: tetratricopeptide repeat protein, partial [Anaerolineae bacterium]|nr:tetratricopeptide repeat protein [Anaerolineae bacterium]